MPATERKSSAINQEQSRAITCNQHAIKCNQHATNMQSACNQVHWFGFSLKMPATERVRPDASCTTWGQGMMRGRGQGMMRG